MNQAVSTILKVGENIHVIHRKLYEGDIHRHFVGVVQACEGALVRVKGNLFAMDAKTNQFMKRDSPRTRIISLDSGEVIVNVLPEQVDIDQISYKPRPGGGFQVTDGSAWHFDITHL
jgi:hypothetical protein